VSDLRRTLRDPESAAETRDLLTRLRKRRDLFATIADEIDELLDRSKEGAGFNSPGAESAPEVDAGLPPEEELEGKPATEEVVETVVATAPQAVPPDPPSAAKTPPTAPDTKPAAKKGGKAGSGAIGGAVIGTIAMLIVGGNPILGTILGAIVGALIAIVF
jgi:hypothetical protein